MGGLVVRLMFMKLCFVLLNTIVFSLFVFHLSIACNNDRICLVLATLPFFLLASSHSTDSPSLIHYSTKIHKALHKMVKWAAPPCGVLGAADSEASSNASKILWKFAIVWIRGLGRKASESTQLQSLGSKPLGLMITFDQVG
ncbi:hypothetical protein L6452_12666 [Arctium lappa]|uniref:Uncharacterized protein n=1 Tax=Arctium lappa TaxID=4217 RepID=A0ACB9DQV7_ARCLA|nr:hypothetical protein L6452_12666 [Arctium lappa]